MDIAERSRWISLPPLPTYLPLPRPPTRPEPHGPNDATAPRTLSLFIWPALARAADSLLSHRLADVAMQVRIIFLPGRAHIANPPLCGAATFRAGFLSGRKVYREMAGKNFPRDARFTLPLTSGASILAKSIRSLCATPEPTGYGGRGRDGFAQRYLFTRLIVGPADLYSKTSNKSQDFNRKLFNSA
jgi:hypothetical protein